MAKKKTFRTKTPVPEGSMVIPPFAFELGDLSKIIEHQEKQRNWTLVFALRYIHDRLLKSRNAYIWKEE